MDSEKGTRSSECERSRDVCASTGGQNKQEHSAHLNVKIFGEALVTVSKVKKGEKVLDLGCGTGHFSAILSDIVGPEGRVVAIDPDRERVKIAQETYARHNIEYLVENDQSFPGDGYDLVFSNHVISHIKDKAALFNRLYAKLRSGGRFAFLTFPECPSFPPVMLKTFSELIAPDFLDRLSKQRYFADSSVYTQLAKSAGFQVTSVELKQSTVHWNSLDDFISYFHGLSHGLFNKSTLDKDALQSFKEKYEEELVSQYPARDVLYVVVTKNLSELYIKTS